MSAWQIYLVEYLFARHPRGCCLRRVQQAPDIFLICSSCQQSDCWASAPMPARRNRPSSLRCSWLDANETELTIPVGGGRRGSWPTRVDQAKQVCIMSQTE